ncbi:MAG: DapH/DapD/GlmU-related protein, partial [Acutalibacteraceae bacterium]|nr:DapH/DapD/GlmU-related protein [Acutalibacteraceae bacterium]
RAERFGKISIGDNVNIGWNVIILPGVTIGNNVVIRAGAVVTKDIPDNSVAAGVPAKVIETIEQYSEKNQERIVLTKDMSPDEKKRFLLGMM